MTGKNNWISVDDKTPLPSEDVIEVLDKFGGPQRARYTDEAEYVTERNGSAIFFVTHWRYLPNVQGELF